MRIVVSTSGEPIYRQIERQVARAVVAGELPDGAPLPSIRQLARDLRVSVITTTRAYAELEQQGFITTVPGRGCFVRTLDAGQVREQLRDEVTGHLREAVAAARLAAMSNTEVVGRLREILKEDDDG